MTEQEWLTGEDPAAMLRVVTPHISSTGHASPFGSTGLRPISDRKLRLFAAACAWNVADAARFCSNVDQFIRNTESWAETGQAPPGVRESSDPVDIHDRAIDHATRAANWALLHRGGRTLQELMAAQAALLRDIVGNPFRPVSIGQDWRPGMPAFVRHGWVQGQPLLTPTVLSLAHAAYDERPRRECQDCLDKLRAAAADASRAEHFAELMRRCKKCGGGACIDDGTLDPVRLAVLADALEEAWCDNEDILRHLRGEERRYDGGLWVGQWTKVPGCGPHVRGDWAVDLVLGEE